MNSSLPSESQPTISSVKWVRRKCLLVVLGALLFLGQCLGLTACQDEIESPTMGTLELDLQSESAGGANGSRILWGDSVLVASTDQTHYQFHLPAGSHRIRLFKECSQILPAPDVMVEIQAGRTYPLSWSIDLAQGALEVQSTMSGADITLDGLPTNRQTPATLSCLTAGSHQVAVHLFGATAGADSSQEVVIGDERVRVDFDLEPKGQSRGVLCELMTATLCPNCPLADAAMEALWSDQELVDAGFVGLQVHTRWGGTDPFANATTIARDLFYGGQEGRGIPWVVTNGLQSRSFRGTGGPSGTVETLMLTYTNLMADFIGSPSSIALYWREPGRDPGVSAGGRLRAVVVEDVLEPALVELWALSYKDQLVTNVPGQGEQTFDRVVREYKRIGSFAELGLSQRGDWTEIEVSFSLVDDTRWSEDRIGLVAFAQRLGSNEGEIVQSVHTLLP